MALERALAAATTHQEDLVLPYVRDLRHVVDMDAIRGAGSRSAWIRSAAPRVPYWEPINALYGLEHHRRQPELDPTFSFMTWTTTAGSAWTARARTRWRGSSG